jgi:hypothetical protein
VNAVSHPIERVEAISDDPSLVANAGLILPATLMLRLGLEALLNPKVRLGHRIGAAFPGRKVCTLVATILAGGSRIDHADVLRAGATSPGPAVPGDGALHAGNVPAGLHLRAPSPARRGDRRDDPAGVVIGHRPRDQRDDDRRRLDDLRATRGRTIASGLAGRRAD